MKKLAYVLIWIIAAIVILVVGTLILLQTMSEDELKHALQELDKMAPPTPNVPAQPSTQAFAEAFQACEKFKLNNMPWLKDQEPLLEKPVAEWTDEDWATARTAAESFQSLLSLIRKAVDTEGPAYPLNFSKGMGMELPHLSKLRDCARFLKHDACVKSRDKDYAAVAENLLTILKLARHLEKEQVLISQMVRGYIDFTAFEIIRPLLPADQLPAEPIQRIIALAGQKIDRKVMMDAFWANGAMTVHSIQKAPGHHIGGPNLRSMNMNGTFKQKAISLLYPTPLGEGFQNQDLVVLTTSLLELGRIYTLPYPESVTAKSQFDANIRSRMNPQFPLTGQLLPGYYNILFPQVRDEIVLRLMQIGFALELTRNQTGRYPDSLDAVAPILGGTVPMDPATEKPFIYRVTGDSILLYSLGKNLKDDQGDTSNYEDGDMVWRGAYPVIKKRTVRTETRVNRN